MLLYRLHLIARRLLPLSSACLLLALAGVLMAIYALVTTRTMPALFLSMAIVLTLWALMLYAFIQLFQQIPAPVLPRDSYFERLRSRLLLWLYHLLALAVGVLGLTLLSMTMKLLFLPE
jgi:hypothetical protein